jgi:3-methyladenine DNA glycosylase AlkD
MTAATMTVLESLSNLSVETIIDELKRFGPEDAEPIAKLLAEHLERLAQGLREAEGSFSTP